MLSLTILVCSLVVGSSALPQNYHNFRTGIAAPTAVVGTVFPSEFQPENIGHQQTHAINQDAMTAVMKLLPELSQGIRDTKTASELMTYLGASIAKIVKENAPIEKKEEVAAQADLTSAILSAVGSFLDDMPAIPQYIAPDVVIPEIVIPKIVIPDFPQIAPANFNSVRNQYYSYQYQHPVNTKVISPEIRIPEVKIDIPQFKTQY